MDSIDHRCFFFFLTLFCRAPFDVSLTVLVIMCVMIVTLWSQNYGDAQASISDSFKLATKYLKEGKCV